MNAPDENRSKEAPQPRTDDLSSDIHRIIIGAIGIVLPFFLVLMARWRPTAGLDPWPPLSSVSAYYYTGGTSAFAGALIALGVYFFTYKGYDNPQRWQDWLASRLAGLAAIAVVFFPTTAPDAALVPSWWKQYMHHVHGFSAVVLFACFTFFCVQFRRSNLAKDSLPPDKRWRNRFYAFCGVVILGCIAWLIFNAFNRWPIFWPEATALIFFALSWLVKGRVVPNTVAVAQKTVHYVEQTVKGKGEPGSKAPQKGD